MSASQGRFLGRGNTAGRPGGRHLNCNTNTGRSSLQQAQSIHNSVGTNKNRFSSLVKDTDLTETEVFGLAQAQLEEEFKEDLLGDILEIQPTGNSRMMDISTAVDAQDMSVSPEQLDDSYPYRYSQSIHKYSSLQPATNACAT